MVVLITKEFSDPIINFYEEGIYSPSTDSYLVIDYLKKCINEYFFDEIPIRNITKILDLGTGTGIIAIFLQILKIQIPDFNPIIYASDISQKALKNAKINERENKLEKEIKFIHSDLFNSFPNSLKHSFDVIIFNPPYLPSSEIIKDKQEIDLSWDGGKEGLELILRFIEEAKLFLSLNRQSFIYLVSSSRTNLKLLGEKINFQGYAHEIVAKTHVFFEDIMLNRLKLQ